VQAAIAAKQSGAMTHRTAERRICMMIGFLLAAQADVPGNQALSV